MELAVADLSGITFFYRAVNIDNQTEIKKYKDKAKQELEKEHNDET